MTLTPAVIEYCKQQLDITNWLMPAENVIGQHVIYEQFIEHTKLNFLPKVVFYISLNDAYGMPREKTDGPRGDLGYRLKVDTSKVFSFNNNKNPLTTMETKNEALAQGTNEGNGAEGENVSNGATGKEQEAGAPAEQGTTSEEGPEDSGETVDAPAAEASEEGEKEGE